MKETTASLLALRGGTPVRTAPFPPYVTIGREEKAAVAEVIDSTVLSQFLGTWSPDFYGGPRVQKLEREWERYFGVKHAVTVNSATSGLIAAAGAAGFAPGDEVIVSPYTMSASASCVLVYGAIPVFADINPETFCITAETIRARITPRTRGIIAVDIFGYPAEMAGILTLAREHGLTVIEDAAQAPGATRGGRYAGTLADIGVFSLNYHKTIHTGEGGVVVTNDDEFAERVRLIRNHAEAVVKDKGVTRLDNLLGFNFRMTEIEAAIGSEQLKKLERLLAARLHACEYLTRGLRGIPGITPPVVHEGVTHGFYVYAIRYDESSFGVPRKVFAAALRAEGIPLAEGYVEPLYLQPMYQKRIALGSAGAPFSYGSAVDYSKGICPVTERMHERELLVLSMCHANVTERDLDDVVQAFHKLSDNREELRAAAASAGA